MIDTYNRQQAAFPGTEIPAVVVVEATDVTDPQVQEAIRRLSEQALASGQMHEPIEVAVNAERTVAQIDVPIDGSGTTTPRTPPSTPCATTSFPRRSGRCPTPRRASPATPPSRATSATR